VPWVANLTRQDGLDFLELAPQIGIVTKTTVYPLKQAETVSNPGGYSARR
jgi:hypothetical protein